MTWGHLPKWMNEKCAKLHIVNHKDFMESRYLPCFNSEAIESCIHRIPGLAENFIYFNDDMFLLQPMKETDFFQNDLPCDSAVVNLHCCEIEEGGTLCNFLNIGIINKYFNMNEVLKKNWKKWFHPIYGTKLLRTIYLLPSPRFPGMLMEHLPQSFRKQSFEKMWELEPGILEMTCMHKFRTFADVNQWLFKEWQLASGEFVPRKCGLGLNIAGLRDLKTGQQAIEKQKYKFLIFNDLDMSEEDFRFTRDELNRSFEKILPHKSQFEK